MVRSSWQATVTVDPVHLMNADWALGDRQPSDQVKQFGLWVCQYASTIHINRRHLLYYYVYEDYMTSRKTSRWVFTARLSPQFRMLLSFNRSTTPHRRFNYDIPASIVLLQQCHCWNRHRGKLQNVSPPSVLFESSRIFLQYAGDTEFWN